MVALKVYSKSLLRVHYTFIMGRLIIYCEHIKGLMYVVFVVNFCHLGDINFQKKNLCLCFDIPNNLLTFLCLWHNKFIATPLFHNETNTMITMWDTMEYAIHTPNFLKLQLEFQTSYMNLKSIHISILKFFILKWKTYTLILNILN